MDYLVIKRDKNIEWRIYPNILDSDLPFFFKGDKRALEINQLSEFLDFKLERNSDRIHLMNYLTDQWVISNSKSLHNNLYESYQTLLKKLENKFGPIRKISIQKIYI